MAYYSNNNPESSAPGEAGQHQTTSFTNSTNTRSYTPAQQQRNLYDTFLTHNPIQTPLYMAADGYGPAGDGARSLNSASHYYPPPNTGQRPTPYYQNMQPQVQRESFNPNVTQFPQNSTGSRHAQDFMRRDSIYPSQPPSAYGPPRVHLPNAPPQNNQHRAASPCQSTRPDSRLTSAAVASKAVDDAIEKARSVSNFIQSAGGSSRQKQRMSVAAGFDQDGPHETNQYEMSSQGAEDAAPRSMGSAAYRDSSNVEADGETGEEALGSEDTSPSSASRALISSSTVSQDAEAGPSESAGKKQAMTQSTVAEVFDDASFKLKWSSADAARDHAFRRIKLSNLKNDDVENVKKDAKKWQKESGNILDHVMTEFDKRMITDQIEATAWLIFEEIVKVHEFGHRPTKHVDETSICSKRLQLAVDCIRDFTRVREDIFTGFDYQEFASHPTAYGKAKMSNLWSNLGKALKAAATKGKPRKTKKRIATANSAIYTRLLSGAEITEMKKEAKAAAARAGDQVDVEEYDDLGELDDEVGPGSGEQLMNPSDGKAGTKRAMPADEEGPAEPRPNKRIKHQTAQGSSMAKKAAQKPKQTPASRTNPQRTTRSTKAVDYRGSNDTSDSDDASKGLQLSIGNEQDEAGAFNIGDEGRDTQFENSNLMSSEEYSGAGSYANAAQRDSSSVGNMQPGLRDSLPASSNSDETAAGVEVLGSSMNRVSGGLGQTADRYNRMAVSSADGNDETEGDDQEGAVATLLDIAETATDPDLIDFDFNAYYGQTGTQ